VNKWKFRIWTSAHTYLMIMSTEICSCGLYFTISFGSIMQMITLQTGVTWILKSVTSNYSNLRVKMTMFFGEIFSEKTLFICHRKLAFFLTRQPQHPPPPLPFLLWSSCILCYYHGLAFKNPTYQQISQRINQKQYHIQKKKS